MNPKNETKLKLSDSSLSLSPYSCIECLLHKYHDISFLLRKYIAHTNKPKQESYFMFSTKVERRLSTQYLIIHGLKSHLIRPNFICRELEEDNLFFQTKRLKNRFFSRRDILLIYSKMETALRANLTPDCNGIVETIKRHKNINAIFETEYNMFKSTTYHKSLKNCFKGLRDPKVVITTDLKLSPVIRFLRKVDQITLNTSADRSPMRFHKSINAGILRPLLDASLIILSVHIYPTSMLSDSSVSSFLEKLNKIKNLKLRLEGPLEEIPNSIKTAIIQPREKFEKLDISIEAAKAYEKLNFLDQIRGLKHLTVALIRPQFYKDYVYHDFLKLMSEIESLDSFKIVQRNNYQFEAPIVEMKSGRYLELKITENQDVEKIQEIVKKWPLSNILIHDISMDESRKKEFEWFELLVQKKELNEFTVLRDLNKKQKNSIEVLKNKEISMSLHEHFFVEELQNFIEKIPENFIISALEFTPKHLESNQLATFFQTCKERVKLKNLSLKFQKIYVTDPIWNELKILEQFELAQIQLILNNCPNFTQARMKAIKSTLFQIRSLKKILISVEGCFQLNLDTIFEILTKCHLQWPDLEELKIKTSKSNIIVLHNKSLELIFTDSTQLDPENLKELEGINNIEKIEKLIINFSNSSILEEQIQSFLDSISSNFETLNTFKLNLTGCGQLREDIGQSIGAFLQKRNFAQLENLSLLLSNTTNETLKNMSLSLPTSMKKFELTISESYDLSSEGLQYLADSLNSISYANLRSFTLIFDQCPTISKQELSTIGDLISNLPLLTELHLSFDEGCVIKDEGIGILLASISSQKTSNLSTLYLKFYHSCRGISDSSCIAFSEMFSRIPSVQDLTLKIRGNQFITDNGMRIFSTGLNRKNLPNLKLLRLWITNFQEIKDDSVQELTLGISTLTNLQELDFNFTINGDITDKGKSAMIINFSGLKLRKLDIEFSCRGSYFSKNYLLDLLKRVNFTNRIINELSKT